MAAGMERVGFIYPHFPSYDHNAYLPVGVLESVGECLNLTVLSVCTCCEQIFFFKGEGL